MTVADAPVATLMCRVTDCHYARYVTKNGTVKALCPEHERRYKAGERFPGFSLRAAVARHREAKAKAKAPRLPLAPGKHVAESVQWGYISTITCACGEAFTGQSDEDIARAFSEHASRAHHESRSGPVERVLPVRDAEDDNVDHNA